MNFTRQLAVFMRAGIPIMEALEVIVEETQKRCCKNVLATMIDGLRAGDTFAAAAAAHPEAFPNYYVGILESAELTGNLDSVLNQLADYIDRDQKARCKVTAALIYPAVVACMSVVVVIVLAVFVLAAVRRVLQVPERQAAAGHSDDARRRPPSSRRGGTSISLVIILHRRRLHRHAALPKGKAKLDALMLKLPVIGDLTQTAILERTCRILSSMLRAGVDLPRSMAVTAESANNAVYRKALDHHPRGDDGRSGPRRTDRPKRALPRSGPPDVPRRRGDRNPRPATRGRRCVLQPRAGDEARADHGALRAGHHHLHGDHRRLRGRRARLGDVRHLQPGQSRMTQVAWQVQRDPPRARSNAAKPASSDRWTRCSRSSDGGLTLMELLIMMVVLPIVIGGLAVGLLSVFSLQSSVSGRLSNTEDSAVAAATYRNDIQSAAVVTTESSSDPQCGSGDQLLGLQWGLNQSTGDYETGVSYTETVNGTTFSLTRQYCTLGNFSTPVSTATLIQPRPCRPAGAESLQPGGEPDLDCQ